MCWAVQIPCVEKQSAFDALDVDVVVGDLVILGDIISFCECAHGRWVVVMSACSGRVG